MTGKIPWLTNEEYFLAVLYPSQGKPWTASQLQRYMYFLDTQLPAKYGAPRWTFEPGDYGPISEDVSEVRERFFGRGVLIESTGPLRLQLSVQGHFAAEAYFSAFDASWREYIPRLSNWVLSLSFTQLVAATRAYVKRRNEKVLSYAPDGFITQVLRDLE